MFATFSVKNLCITDILGSVKKKQRVCLEQKKNANQI